MNSDDHSSKSMDGPQISKKKSGEIKKRHNLSTRSSIEIPDRRCLRLNLRMDEMCEMDDDDDDDDVITLPSLANVS